MDDLDARWRLACQARPGMAVYRDSVDGHAETLWPVVPRIPVEVPIPDRQQPDVSECYLDTTRRRWQPRWRWLYVREGQVRRSGYVWTEKDAMAALDAAVWANLAGQ